MNEWLRTITGWVMLASGKWEFNGQVYQTNFVADQKEYVLPTTMIILNRVECKYPDATEYVLADEVDEKQTTSAIANDEITSATESNPLYRLFDNSIEIYPVPDAAVTNGLRVEVLDDVTEISAAGDSPNLNPLVHHALAVGAAWEFALREEMWTKARQLEGRLLGRPGASPADSLKSQIERLASQRDKSIKQRLIPRKVSYK